MTAARRPLVIGVGQPHRGDDALGLAALTALAAALPEGVADRVAHHGEGLGLMALWEGRSTVVVLDALDAGRPPGTLLRVAASAGPIPSRAFRASSHAFGVAEAVETARALGRLPHTLVLLGAQGANWRLGAPLSPEVIASLPSMVDIATRIISDTVLLHRHTTVMLE